jgi:hypothetical protein
MRMAGFLLILPFLFLHLMAAGQNTFNAGIIAGLNAAQIDGDRMVGYDKVGINAGLVAQLWFSERWGLSMELLFSEKGSRDRGSEMAIASPERFYMSYAEVPVSLLFRERSFLALGGLSYGRLLRNVYTDPLGGESSLNIRSNASSVFLGLGWYFNDHLGIEARASHSVFNLVADDSFAPLFHRYLTFRLFYIL